MLDPMLMRLASCVIFAGLFGGLLFTVSHQDGASHRDTVKVAELQKQVESVLFTRP